jgi:hypothetical protein
MNGFVMFVALLRAAGTDAAAPHSPAAPRVPVEAAPVAGAALATPPEAPLVRLRERVEALNRFVIQESETWCCYAFIGSLSAGLGSEWYLGHGLAAGVESEFSRCRFALVVSLNWYPIEGVQLSAGLDVLHYQPITWISLAP